MHLQSRSMGQDADSQTVFAIGPSEIRKGLMFLVYTKPEVKGQLIMSPCTRHKHKSKVLEPLLISNPIVHKKQKRLLGRHLASLCVLCACGQEDEMKKLSTATTTQLQFPYFCCFNIYGFHCSHGSRFKAALGLSAPKEGLWSEEALLSC